jgi:hypothetical protein
MKISSTLDDEELADKEDLIDIERRTMNQINNYTLSDLEKGLGYQVYSLNYNKKKNHN